MELSCDGCMIGVGNWEGIGFKKPVLYVTIENHTCKLASFNDQIRADIFSKFLEEIAVKDLSEALIGLRDLKE